MRSRAEIQEYQRQYYLDCLLCDLEGMRQKWRDARTRRVQKLRSIGAERSSNAHQKPMPLKQDSI